MAGLRFLPIFVVLVICYQAGLVFGGGHVSSLDNPIATLREVLDEAVKGNVIARDNANRLIKVCKKQGLTKRSPGEVLEEALQIGWRNAAINGLNSEKLKMWASKFYPDTFEPLPILSSSDVVALFKSNVPDIESQLGQLSGKKLKAVEVAASVLNDAIDGGGITVEKSAKVVEEIIKSALNENGNAMTVLNKGLSNSVSRKFIPESFSWFVIRAAVNENVDK